MLLFIATDTRPLDGCDGHDAHAFVQLFAFRYVTLPLLYRQ